MVARLVKKWGQFYPSVEYSLITVKDSKAIWLNDNLINNDNMIKLCVEKVFNKNNRVLGINTKSEYIPAKDSAQQYER